MTTNLEASDTLTRRNSYVLAIESEDMKVAMENKEDPHGGGDVENTTSNIGQKKKAINFFRALLIPGVIVVRIFLNLSTSLPDFSPFLFS